jgi:hypothetical protein
MSWADDEGLCAYDDYNFTDDDDCVWVTKDGQDIMYDELETSHILNIIKMFKFTKKDMPNLFKELKRRIK